MRRTYDASFDMIAFLKIDMHKEHNYEEWKEIRSRTDSIANAVFLIAGGALSLSINVMIGNKQKLSLPRAVIDATNDAWFLLLGSIIIFLFIKVTLIGQAMLLQFKEEFVNKHLLKINTISWILGGIAFICFVMGMFKMVEAAVLILSN